jgi:hypothetical protein
MGSFDLSPKTGHWKCRKTEKWFIMDQKGMSEKITVYGRTDCLRIEAG